MLCTIWKYIVLVRIVLKTGFIHLPKNTPEYPRIPLECPRIPQNTNNIKILIYFLFFIFFYSVDGDTLKKATLIELLFVLLNY